MSDFELLLPPEVEIIIVGARHILAQRHGRMPARPMRRGSPDDARRTRDEDSPAHLPVNAQLRAGYAGMAAVISAKSRGDIHTCST